METSPHLGSDLPPFTTSNIDKKAEFYSIERSEREQVAHSEIGLFPHPRTTNSAVWEVQGYSLAIHISPRPPLLPLRFVFGLLFCLLFLGDEVGSICLFVCGALGKFGFILESCPITLLLNIPINPMAFS